MSNKHILLVEDDPNFGALLKDYLELHQFTITLCTNGYEGWNAFRNGNFSLCICDVMLPMKDGFTLAEDIKKIAPEQPLIFLTAKGLKENMLRGFRIGADDYITKPFDSELLLHKINAILRRNPKAEVTLRYEIGMFVFDVKQRQITGNKNLLYKLSPKETQLLQLLCEHMNDIMPRNKALQLIWKDDNYFTSRSMDVYLAKLRKYLSADATVSIANLHGSGYSLITGNTQATG